MNPNSMNHLLRKLIRRIFRRQPRVLKKSVAKPQPVSSKSIDSTSDVSSTKTKATANSYPEVQNTTLQTPPCWACQHDRLQSRSKCPTCALPKKDSSKPRDPYKLLPMPTIPASELKMVSKQDENDINDREWRRKPTELRLLHAKRAGEDCFDSEMVSEQILPALTLQEESVSKTKVPAITLTAAGGSLPTMDVCTWVVLGMKTWGPVDVDVTIRLAKARVGGKR